MGNQVLNLAQIKTNFNFWSISKSKQTTTIVRVSSQPVRLLINFIIFSACLLLIFEHKLLHEAFFFVLVCNDKAGLKVNAERRRRKKNEDEQKKPN
jgi:hypothetical protein